MCPNILQNVIMYNLYISLALITPVFSKFRLCSEWCVLSYSRLQWSVWVLLTVVSGFNDKTCQRGAKIG